MGGGGERERENDRVRQMNDQANTPDDDRIRKRTYIV